MSDGKLTGWGTLITGLATIGLAVVAYLTYAHPRDKPGQQSFSVSVNTQRGSGGPSRPVKEVSLNFEVKSCNVGSKQVSCSLTVVSPGYDRRFMIGYGTRIIDGDGDYFPMSNGWINLSLERNQQLPFKLSFNVNKDVVRPLTVKIVGSIDNEALDKGFEIR